MQRFAAYLSLATVLTLACLVPMGFRAPLNGAGDAILLIYLLTLSGICTLLAGLAAGSTYAGILGPLTEDVHLAFHERQKLHGQEGRRGREPHEGAQEKQSKDVFQLLLLHAGQAEDLLALALPESLHEMPEMFEDGRWHDRPGFSLFRN